jgi:hypothetical protein
MDRGNSRSGPHDDDPICLSHLSLKFRAGYSSFTRNDNGNDNGNDNSHRCMLRVPRGAANAVRTRGTGRTCRLGLSPLSPPMHSDKTGHRRLTSTCSPLLRPFSRTRSVLSLSPSLSSRAIPTPIPVPRTPSLTTHHRSVHPPARPPLTVLALESSADDSCAAVVTSSREILANIVIKQHHINARYGGIHPIKAQDAHAYGVVSGAWATVEAVSRLCRDCVETVSATVLYRSLCWQTRAQSLSPDPRCPTVSQWHLAVTRHDTLSLFLCLVHPLSRSPVYRPNDGV